jgi:hypothetical protein
MKAERTQELLTIPLIFCRMILDIFGSPRGGKTENVGQLADERESQQTFLTLSTHGYLSLSVQ